MIDSEAHPVRPLASTQIEVFADITCPFAYVGLRRLIDRRAELGRTDIRLHLRAWPLELVNSHPVDAVHVAENVSALRAQVAPDLFRGFEPTTFPSSSLPALALASGAYWQDPAHGERVSLSLRTALFEEGLDISDPDVLRMIAERTNVNPECSITELHTVVSDWHEGQRRGVIGSPHFFVGKKDWFCPTLTIVRQDGQLSIRNDQAVLQEFLETVISS